MSIITISSTPEALDIITDGYVSRHTPEVGAALEEFFRDQTDKELGRWRYPENPDWLVYPAISRAGKLLGVKVVSESTGNNYGPYREIDVSTNRTGLTETVAWAYFQANPRAWHRATPGEVWLVKFAGEERTMTVFLDETGPEPEKFFGFWDGPDPETIWLTDPSIEAARRVFPGP